MLKIIEDGIKCKGYPVYRIVPGLFSPKTNVYGRMSDRIFPMIAEVGLYKYIYMVATDLFPSHNIQNNICAIQPLICGSDDVAFKVNEDIFKRRYDLWPHIPERTKIGQVAWLCG